MLAACIFPGWKDTAVLAEPAQFLEGSARLRFHVFDPFPVLDAVPGLRRKPGSKHQPKTTPEEYLPEFHAKLQQQ
jgi:hypothetical protein